MARHCTSELPSFLRKEALGFAEPTERDVTTQRRPLGGSKDTESAAMVVAFGCSVCGYPSWLSPFFFERVMFEASKQVNPRFGQLEDCQRAAKATLLSDDL